MSNEKKPLIKDLLKENYLKIKSLKNEHLEDLTNQDSKPTRRKINKVAKKHNIQIDNEQINNVIKHWKQKQFEKGNPKYLNRGTAVLFYKPKFIEAKETLEGYEHTKNDRKNYKYAIKDARKHRKIVLYTLQQKKYIYKVDLNASNIKILRIKRLIKSGQAPNNADELYKAFKAEQRFLKKPNNKSIRETFYNYRDSINNNCEYFVKDVDKPSEDNFINRSDEYSRFELPIEQLKEEPLNALTEKISKPTRRKINKVAKKNNIQINNELINKVIKLWKQKQFIEGNKKYLKHKIAKYFYENDFTNAKEEFKNSQHTNDDRKKYKDAINTAKENRKTVLKELKISKKIYKNSIHHINVSILDAKQYIIYLKKEYTHHKRELKNSPDLSKKKKLKDTRKELYKIKKVLHALKTIKCFTKKPTNFNKVLTYSTVIKTAKKAESLLSQCTDGIIDIDNLLKKCRRTYR